MKKIYSVHLDEDVVKKVKENINKFGGKLSPLINKLLEEFLIENGRR